MVFLIDPENLNGFISKDWISFSLFFVDGNRFIPTSVTVSCPTCNGYDTLVLACCITFLASSMKDSFIHIKRCWFHLYLRVDIYISVFISPISSELKRNILIYLELYHVWFLCNWLCSLSWIQLIWAIKITKIYYCLYRGSFLQSFFFSCWKMLQ